MELRMILLLVAITTVAASPAGVNADEDLTPAEGRSQYTRSDYGPSQGGQGPLYAPSAYAAPRQGHVTSYNRRGPSAEYGLRFSGQSSYGGPSEYDHAQSAPAYAPAPIAATYGHQQDERGYDRGGSRYGGGGYGPSNSISGQSQQYSQDPEYDPSKDPVSQYAAYIPVREYGPKKNANHREALSIYGYRK